MLLKLVFIVLWFICFFGLSVFFSIPLDLGFFVAFFYVLGTYTCSFVNFPLFCQADDA